MEREIDKELIGLAAAKQSLSESSSLNSSMSNPFSNPSNLSFKSNASQELTYCKKEVIDLL